MVGIKLFVIVVVVVEDAWPEMNFRIKGENVEFKKVFAWLI